MRSLEGSAQGGKRLCRQQVCATAVGLTRSADLPRLFHGKLCSTASRWCAMTPVQGKSWHQSSSKSVFSSRNQCSHPGDENTDFDAFSMRTAVRVHRDGDDALVR